MKDGNRGSNFLIHMDVAHELYQVAIIQKKNEFQFGGSRLKMKLLVVYIFGAFTLLSFSNLAMAAIYEEVNGTKMSA